MPIGQLEPKVSSTSLAKTLNRRDSTTSPPFILILHVSKPVLECCKWFEFRAFPEPEPFMINQTRRVYCYIRSLVLILDGSSGHGAHAFMINQTRRVYCCIRSRVLILDGSSGHVAHAFIRRAGYIAISGAWCLY